jgi:hypothetical protein
LIENIEKQLNFMMSDNSAAYHAWQKVVQNRQRCYNFFNFHADCTKFSIDIEHIILTNRAVFVFGLFIFWRENDVTNMAPKI